MSSPFATQNFTITILSTEMINSVLCEILFLQKENGSNFPKIYSVEVTQKHFKLLNLGNYHFDHDCETTYNHNIDNCYEFEPFNFSDLNHEQLEILAKYYVQDWKKIKLSDFQSFANPEMCQKYFSLITAKYKSYYTVIPVDLALPLPNFQVSQKVYRSGVNLYVDARSSFEADSIFENSTGIFTLPKSKIAYWSGKSILN